MYIYIYTRSIVIHNYPYIDHISIYQSPVDAGWIPIFGHVLLAKPHWIPWKMTWNPTKSYEIPLLVSPKSRWLGQNHHRQGRSVRDGIPCGPTTGDETKVAGLIDLVSLWFQRTVWCPDYPGPNNGICWNILEFTNDGIWWMVCHFTNYNGNTSCNRATNVLTWGF